MKYAIAVACCAIGVLLAIDVSGAAAKQAHLTAFNTEAKEHVEATVSAREVEEEEDTFEMIEGEGEYINCSESRGTGSLNKESTTLKYEPVYSGCIFQGTFVTHIDPEGCEYEYTLGEEIKPDLFSTELGIECPEKGTEKTEIKIEITNLLQTKAVCLITVPPQTIQESGAMTDMTEADPTDVTSTEDFTKISYTAKALGGIGCEEMPAEGGMATLYGNTTETAVESSNQSPVDLEANTLNPTG